MQRITTLSLALGLAIATAGTAAAQVKLAVGGPITGPSAATGAQMKNGVDQAAADINKTGGIAVNNSLTLGTAAVAFAPITASGGVPSYSHAISPTLP